jgi:hypothetical protein
VRHRFRPITTIDPVAAARVHYLASTEPVHVVMIEGRLHVSREAMAKLREGADAMGSVAAVGINPYGGMPVMVNDALPFRRQRVKPRDARRQKQRDYERGQVKRAADMHGLITCMDVFKPKSLRVPIN